MSTQHPNHEMLVELNQLNKVFVSDDVETWALNNINLRISKGEYLAITGPSGCGKSTLLAQLGLLDTSTDGTYWLAGHDAAQIDKNERARIRNKEIGFIFQAFNLISDLSVEDNVALPLTYRQDLSREQRRARVTAALEQVEMVHRASHFPAQLSGGQQQRVAIARAIAGEPAIILADEPTGNLDSKNAAAVMTLLDTLHHNGATICMVTHDMSSALRTGRIIEMKDGAIVSDSPTSARSAIAV
ncbi:ABC transporter ATP-binding protein [Pseudoalteromonas rubra]|uniref:ABC transporter ATP-binding protein n=1 Tax=Pseudoalteromonas rubra TaxID=43658 RepID=A0A5S3WPF1_9GAMM|nr:ABC transporter ATP-binding protein [Pseudoalteromonas rubra]TMP29409.1 ABC transporter ATP-binding protein [Pseudoalteromonas rubra]TMP33989.1 ABC transporter ATP-binding protein [Pseudoalteromonas rubra]